MDVITSEGMGHVAGHVKKRRRWKAKPAPWFQVQADVPPLLSKRLSDLGVAGPGCSPTQAPVGRPVKQESSIGGKHITIIQVPNSLFSLPLEPSSSVCEVSGKH